MKKVVIALSGGVDSSVSAYLLKKEGYDVVGLFMKNWHDESVTISDECPWLDDSNDAMIVAQNLDIPFQTVDLSKQYNDRIINYMFSEYKNGRTPNPDILCNREIKFDIFMKIALDLGADFVATGHYSRIVNDKINGKTIYKLMSGVDKSKDQSYFLCQLNQNQLSKIIFPIGNLDKAKVRKIANEIGLVNASKKDSQGLCFVGKIKLPVFLQQQIKKKKGDIIEISQKSPIYDQPPAMGSEFIYSPKDGIKIGEHDGCHYYTVGQRKGLEIGGRKEPLFILATNIKYNIIFVGMGKNHPGLYRKNLKIKTNEVHWLINQDAMAINTQKDYLVRIRHRQELQKAKLIREQDYLYILFQNKQRGISKGQFATWYQSNQVIGSGPID